VLSSGRTMLSVKEAVQLAQNNNFMGLICSSRLLDLAPPLIESIKTAGLVLISDVSGLKPPFGPRGVPDGVDGTVKGNGVLHFNDSVDM
jgi:CDK inhibitor PHO81